MFDSTKIRKGNCIKNRDLISELQKEDPEAMVSICGANEIFIHVDTENNIIVLDNEDLHDDYEEDFDSSEIPEIICPVTFNK